MRVMLTRPCPELFVMRVTAGAAIVFVFLHLAGCFFRAAILFVVPIVICFGVTLFFICGSSTMCLFHRRETLILRVLRSHIQALFSLPDLPNQLLGQRLPIFERFTRLNSAL